MKTKFLILLFPLFLFAGAPPATNVGAMIAPTDSADIYGTHNSLWGRGGFREVLNTTARNAIPPLRRVMGMLVYCTADSTTYQLRGDTTNASWQVYKLGKCVPDSAGKYPDSLFLKSLQVKTIYGHDSVAANGAMLDNLNLRAKLITMIAPGSNNKLWWTLDASSTNSFYLTARHNGTGGTSLIFAGDYAGTFMNTMGNWSFTTITPDSIGGRTARFSGSLFGANATLTGMSAAGFVENSALGLLSTHTAAQALGDIGALGLHATADSAIDAGKVGGRAASYFLPSTALPNGTAGVLAMWLKTGSDTLVGTNVTETGSLLYTTDSLFVNGRGIRTTSRLQGDTIIWTKKLNADSSNAYDNRYAAKFISGTANYFWATPNGSAGVPSLRAFVAADLPNLGTANTIAMFGTTGLTASAITQAGGKVTIGNTNNSYFLGNSGATTGYCAVDFTNTGGDMQLGIATSAGGFWGSGVGDGVAYCSTIGTSTATPLVFATSGVGQAILSAAGTWGLGIQAAAKLQILSVNKTMAGDVDNTNAALKHQIAAYTSDAAGIDIGASIGLWGNYLNHTNYATFGAIAGRKENATPSDNKGYLSLYARTATGLAEAVRITSGLLVGIGCTPVNKLTIAGDLGFSTVQTVTMSGNDNTTAPTSTNIEVCGSFTWTPAPGTLPDNTLAFVSNSDGSSPSVTTYYQGAQAIHNCGFWMVKKIGHWYRLIP